MSNAYRIADKGNVHIGGKPATSYDVFVYDARQSGYVYAGNGLAPGHDRTDAQCWADWRRRETSDDIEDGVE